MPDDFKSYIKVKIDNQYFNKDILPSHYKVKEYCPLVFKRIRERFGISDESYLNSLTNGDIEPLDCSSGKSNAKFFVSYDKRYIIKTIASEDVEGLHNILKDYHKHIVETKGDTLLPHLLSMYRLTVEDKENYMLVMRNIFTNRYKIHIKYDIKGSTVDRAASNKEKEKDSPTFKDNDFVNDGRHITIGTEAKKAFMQKLTRDVEVSLC
jgi:1-phosphatidylinositol-5-phosphate 4-kinase